MSADIHPIQNLRVMAYLRQKFGQTEESAFTWSRHWIETGFDAYEATLKQGGAGTYSHGDRPTMADLCLVPQVFNAARFKVDMQRYPLIGRIHEACMKLPAFDAASPRNSRTQNREKVLRRDRCRRFPAGGRGRILPAAEGYAATRLRAALEQGGLKAETVKVGLLDRTITLRGISGGAHEN